MNERKIDITEDEAILKYFPVGTKIWSTIGEGGGTEVFIGDSGLAQPFSYLGDYNPNHYTDNELDAK